VASTRSPSPDQGSEHCLGEVQVQKSKHRSFNKEF
jgi:hypothetical protein